MEWWEEHGGVITENAQPLREALELFSTWVKKLDPKRVWSVGTCFERPMLEGALDAVDLPLPWHFSQGFDLRTEWKLAFPGRTRPRGSHRAVEDCRSQIKQLGEVLAARPLPVVE